MHVCPALNQRLFSSPLTKGKGKLGTIVKLLISIQGGIDVRESFVKGRKIVYMFSKIRKAFSDVTWFLACLTTFVNEFVLH